MTHPGARSRTQRVARVAAGTVLAIAGLGVVALIDVSGDRPAQRPSAAQREAAAAPTVPAGQIGPGVWLVGSDVAPGTYRSSGASGDRYCMWSRHSSAAGGSMDDILASDGQRGAGQMIVTIQSGDALFRTNGCAPFVKVD